MCMCMLTCMYVYECMCTCMGVYGCVCVYVYVYICEPVYMCICMCVILCVYVYVCVCVYVEGSQDLIFSIITYSEGHLYIKRSFSWPSLSYIILKISFLTW